LSPGFINALPPSAITIFMQTPLKKEKAT